MDQGLYWEADSSSPSQNIPHILWNPKVYYHVYKCPLLDPVLSHMNPLHILPSYFFNIHFNLISLCTPVFSKRSLFLRLPHKQGVHVPVFQDVPHGRTIPSPLICPPEWHLVKILNHAAHYMNFHVSFLQLVCGFRRFREITKNTLTFLMAVRMKELVFHWTDSREILYVCRENSNFVQFWQE
jgi:hypothetical protein